MDRSTARRAGRPFAAFGLALVALTALVTTALPSQPFAAPAGATAVQSVQAGGPLCVANRCPR